MNETNAGLFIIYILSGICFLAISGVWRKCLSQVLPNGIPELGDQRASVLHLTMKWANHMLIASIGYLIIAILLIITGDDKVHLLFLIVMFFLISSFHANTKAIKLLKSKGITWRDFRKHVPKATGIYRIFIPGTYLIIILYILIIAWLNLWLPDIVYDVYSTPKYELKCIKQEFNNQWKTENTNGYDLTDSSGYISKLEKYKHIYDNTIERINNIEDLDKPTRRAHVYRMLLGKKAIEDIEIRIENIERDYKSINKTRNLIEKALLGSSVKVDDMLLKRINENNKNIKELARTLQELKNWVMSLDTVQNPYDRMTPSEYNNNKTDNR